MEWFSVVRGTIRGRIVEVWMRDCEGMDDCTVIDFTTRRVMPWSLTLDEVASIEDVLTAP